MCCWLIIAFAFAPRLALFFMWLTSDRLSATFGGSLVPFLGFFLLPWATLVFALVAPGGLSSLDVVFIVIAVVADLGAYGGGWRERSHS